MHIRVQVYGCRVCYTGRKGAQILTHCALDLGSDDPEVKTKKLSAELANGRLTMMAIIGMFFQDGLTGSAWGDWANYTDSPLRAVEAPDLSSELGACPPPWFWDPLDLSKFDDPVVATTQFKRRRVIELQHGRVSMLFALVTQCPNTSSGQGTVLRGFPQRLRGR